MIIVTGATGQLGRAIVEKLVQRVPADQVGVSVRDPAKATDLSSLGVRVRKGDFEQPELLAHAFEGATQVLIVSSNARAQGGDPLAQHRAAIAAAHTAGARRIVYTSHMAVSTASQFLPMHDHAATEEILRQSGVAWTALRNGFYATAGVQFMAESFKTGLLETPEDGTVSWTTHADLGEAAAIILSNEGQFEGPTPPLTSLEALDFDGLAGIASELLGHTIRRQLITDDDFRARMVARGVPARAADIALGFYRASRVGEFATVDPTLEQLLGRRPFSMRHVIAQKVKTV